VLRAIRHLHGSQCWGWPASAFTGSGHPDLFGCYRGSFFGLELKTATGRLTQRQKLALIGIRKAGGYAWVIRTVEQALIAMAYIECGAHPPMPDQPLDIDDFFASLDNPTPTAPAQVDEPDMTWDFPPAQTPETGVLDAVEEIAPEGPSHEEVLADLDARGDALDGKLPTVDDIQAARDAGLLGADAPDPMTDVAAFKALVFKISQDVRAAGDRTTMVYEELHSLRIELTVTRNIVQALERATRQLIALISDGEELPEVPVMPEPEAAPEPPKRRTRRS
jgi:hypothetical protein